VSEWLEKNRDPSFLLGGGRLIQAEEWAVDHLEEGTRERREFLAASVSYRDQESQHVRAREKAVASTGPSTNHDIFLSYSAKDGGIAEAVCRHLEAGGVRCWMAPRDIAAGEDWGEAILDAIEKTKLLILLLSSSSNTSKDVRREVQLAANKDRIILPVRLEDIHPSKSLEYLLSVTQWFDASKPASREAHWARLTQDVLRALGRSRK
jgi:TIR domain